MTPYSIQIQRFLRLRGVRWELQYLCVWDAWTPQKAADGTPVSSRNWNDDDLRRAYAANRHRYPLRLRLFLDREARTVPARESTSVGWWGP